jgi:ribosomal protein L30E
MEIKIFIKSKYMKNISHLPTLDPGNIPIFNDIIPYHNKRDRRSLLNNRVIQSLRGRTKNRVVASLLLPSETSLKLHDDVIYSPIINDCIAHVIGLYRKIIEICNPNDILFVAVLRSGLFLATLLRYIINKLHNIEVKIVGITPNYINHMYIDEFKNLVSESNKSVFFIDGWCSTGITYKYYIKKMWRSLFPKRKFYYAVVSNISPIKDSELLYETNKDVLLPWSICQTDYIGLSNYFLNPFTNLSTAFYLSKPMRKIQNIDRIYKKIINKILIIQGRKYLNSDDKEYCNYKINKKIDLTKYGPDVKIGINECIKTLDKNDALEILVDKKIDKLYYNLLRKYAKIYRVKIKTVDKLSLDKSKCLVIRKNN